MFRVYYGLGVVFLLCGVMSLGAWVEDLNKGKTDFLFVGAALFVYWSALGVGALWAGKKRYRGGIRTIAGALCAMPAFLFVLGLLGDLVLKQPLGDWMFLVVAVPTYSASAVLLLYLGHKRHLEVTGTTPPPGDEHERTAGRPSRGDVTMRWVYLGVALALALFAGYLYYWEGRYVPSGKGVGILGLLVMARGVALLSALLATAALTGYRGGIWSPVGGMALVLAGTHCGAVLSWVLSGDVGGPAVFSAFLAVVSLPAGILLVTDGHRRHVRLRNVRLSALRKEDGSGLHQEPP